MIEYEKYQKSLKHLELQFANHMRALDRPELATLDREAIAESVIQRFETCYDSLWKVLKRHLVEVMGLPDVPNSPKPVFRLADQNHLLPSPVETWFAYANARVNTTHDYSGSKAATTLTIIAPFIEDAIALYRGLTGRSWE
ncbi:MAG: nucleotidyltransferase substrate binding protein [Magnetococcales bacterium]|nr:nucleotidyltransferase substrate binding protein [Magnetococcales bacterium]